MGKFRLTEICLKENKVFKRLNETLKKHRETKSVSYDIMKTD